MHGACRGPDAVGCLGRGAGRRSLRSARAAAHDEPGALRAPAACLGVLPYCLIFLALVGALLRLGLIKGWDVISDSSLHKA
jgi:hypothetical protein